MPKRPKHHKQRTDEPQQAAPPASRYHYDHYQKTRHWALYEGKDLLAVTVYRKGAQAMLKRLQADAQTIADQQGVCSECVR